MSTSVLVGLIVLFTMAAAALVALVIGMIDVETKREEEIIRRWEGRS